MNLTKDYQDNYVPGWITSFAQLDAVEVANDLQEQYTELFCDYISIAQNILVSASYTPPTSQDMFAGYESYYVVDLLNNLNAEFTSRLSELQTPQVLRKEKVSSLSKGDIIYWAFLDDKGNVTDNGVGEIASVQTSGKHGDFKATPTDPAYEINVLQKTAKDKVYKRTKTKAWKRAAQIRKVDGGKITKETFSPTAKPQTFFLNKESDGTLRWYGIVSNNYQDTDGHTIAASAHENFVNKLINKEVEYPELWVWHLPQAVGSTEYVQFSDNFITAAGTIFKEYEELVTNLVDITEDMRMSHGMPRNQVKILKDNTIVEYVSKEFTLLPGEFASNKLTYYGVTEDGKN